MNTKKEGVSNQSIVEQIIDGIDFSKIYKTTIEDRKITEEERKILLSKLDGVDCKRIYDSFINVGVNSSDVSGYIINILMDNGFKGYTLEELSKLESLDDIISRNIKNLNNRIQAVRLDKLLGIDDDSYEVDGTGIKLRDYQYDTLQNIDEIYKTKRFAGMILPTGAGKSFVAMAEMMKFKNSNIVFIAPQNAILLQFQKHIVKNILKRDDVADKDLSKTIEEVFPHLKMFCYDTIGSRDEEWLKSLDADLIILDELHRSGAETWEPKIKKLIELNSNAKILGMTATPIRDVDSKDMTREIAEMVSERTTKELNQQTYLASEMYLLDAMRDGIVVCPKIVTFDYTLDQSQEYKEVKRMIEEEKKPSKKAELKEIYDKMTRIIKKSEKDGMSKIILENIKKKDGRYIVFLPNNPDSRVSTEEYIKQKIEEVKEYFKEIDFEPEVSFLLSNRADKNENLKALSDFESSNSNHLKLIFAINMLNEGVHVDDIDGAVMLRPISDNSKILYLQQIGRCIFALDPDDPINENDIPIIFDVYNNYLAHDIDREINKTNSTSDLQRLQSIINWIKKHKGYFPDINSEIESEAKKAIILKNIQNKYKRYISGINNNNLDESDILKIQKILDLGSTIELWDIEIPDRIIKPEEKYILKNKTFTATGTQRKFLDLFNEAKRIKKERKLTRGLRLKNILSVLETLSEYGFEINNRTIDKVDTLSDVIEKLPEEVRKEVLEGIDVEIDFNIGEEYNFAKQAFYNRSKIFLQYNIKDLRKFGIFEPFISEKYDMQIRIVEGKFITHGPELFKNINIETGTIFNEKGFDKSGYDVEGYNRNGYDRLGYDRENFRVGEKYNYYGFDRNHIHKETETIYDRYGFKFDKTYKETGELYNPSGFNIDKKHKVTNTIRDEDGYDIDGVDIEGFHREVIGTIRINKYGFDNNGYYYEKQEDGTYESTGLKYNRFGFLADKKHVITKSKIDVRRFDIDGKCKGNRDSLFDVNGFRQDGTYKNTGQYYYNGYNAFGVDENGRNRLGKIDPDIIFAREYILGIYHGKRKEVLEKYRRKDTSFLSEIQINTKLYRACEMYPKMKEFICKIILTLQKEIQKREEKIRELRASKDIKEKEVEQLEKQNTILKARIEQIDDNVFEIDK